MNDNYFDNFLAVSAISIALAILVIGTAFSASIEPVEAEAVKMAVVNPGEVLAENIHNSVKITVAALGLVVLTAFGIIILRQQS